MANWLTDMKRQRMVNALKSPATQWQAMASNAPIGAVGAPSGLLAPPQPKPTNYLGGLLGAASMVPGIGDAAGIAADARMYLTDPKSRTKGNYAMSALGMLPFMPALATVFHGSPHKFDAFDMSKIGTGEGAQAYGHGLYLAENPDVAKSYQTALAAERGFSYGGKSGLTRAEVQDMINSELPGYLDGVARPSAVADFVMDDMATGIASRPDGFLPRKYKPDSERAKLYEKLKSQIKHADPGAFYTVDLPDEAIAKMLDWDKPLSEQAEAVKVAAMDLGLPETATGKDIYNALVNQARDANIARNNLKDTTLPGSQAAASRDLAGFGIPGIRYLDGGSRSGGKGTSNYVVFDDKLPKILKRE